MATTFIPVYAASVAIGVGTAFNALATSTTRTAGAQTDQFDNTSTLYDDVLLSGSVKLGTTPTANKQVDVWVVACKDGGTTYPTPITNAGAVSKVFGSENQRNAAAKLLKTMLTEGTTGSVLEFSNESVEALFGGVVPQKFILFLAHDSAVNLDASAGFVVNALGVQYQATP